MKWQVVIPKPPVKRMEGSGKLFIRYDDGWSGGFAKQLPLEPDQTIAEFEVSEEYEWIGSTSICDGTTFEVWVEYSNSTGSRKTNVRLVPQKVENV